MGIDSGVRAALEPYVGAMVADTCVRATAIKLGKSVDELGPQDLPELEANIRRLLGQIAPPAAIDDAITTLRAASREAT